MSKWKLCKLEEVCDFQNGFAFKSTSFTKEGEPIIRISDIKNGEIDDSNVVYFNPASYKEDLSRFLVFPNDILIAMSGGTTGKIGVNTTNKTFYLNQRVGVFREKAELNHNYLYYYLITKSEESLRIAAGAAQPNLSTAQIKSFIIPVPPLSEQQRIVDILDAEFAKIDALKEIAEKNLQKAKDLFQAVLRKELEPKEGWNTASLSELYDVRDGTHDSPKYVSTGYPFVTSKNLKNGEIDMSDVKYISKADFDKINERSKVDKGDVLFAMIGSNLGHPALVVDEPQYAIKNVALFKVPTNMSGLLLTYLLSSDIVMNKVNKEKNGSSQPFVSLKYLRNFIVSVPKTLKEQDELASAIKQQDIRCQTIIDHYYKTCLLCNDLKQALLRKAFNGEL